VVQANLLVALDASSSISFFGSATNSIDPTDFGAVTTAAPVKFFSGSSPHSGTLFRWRAQLAPNPAVGNSSVGGLQWQLQVK